MIFFLKKIIYMKPMIIDRNIRMILILKRLKGVNINVNKIKVGHVNNRV